MYLRVPGLYQEVEISWGGISGWSTLKADIIILPEQTENVPRLPLLLLLVFRGLFAKVCWMYGRAEILERFRIRS